MIRYFLILLFAFARFTFSSAQTDNKLTIVSPDKQRIEVVGTAEKIVEPDIIYVSITLKEKMKDGVKITVENQEDILKNELVSIGLNLDKLTLTDANTETIKVSKKTKWIITTKSYSLKLSTVADVKKTFLILDKMEISEANITGTDISNRLEIMKSTRIEAIKAAKKKAEYLLQAIGHELDKPIVIRELEERPFAYSTLSANFESNMSNGQIQKMVHSELLDTNELKIEKITITARIYIEYGIK